MATITSLADSRFDWERVMRELSLILPHDVWLVSLDATPPRSGRPAAPAAAAPARACAARSPGPPWRSAAAPAGQEAVAGFVTALKDIDGVTRVGVQSSELAEQTRRGRSEAAARAATDCHTRDFIAKFEIVVAFDAAPVPAERLGGRSARRTARPKRAEASSTESSEEGG